MFRHQGKTRTLNHNLRIASLLSFIAGIVNVAGFLAVQRLTTNVTGHFAFFIDEIFKLHFWQGLIYFSYIFFFFLGAVVSGFCVELMLNKSEKNIYIIPALLECLILLIIGFAGTYFINSHPDIIAFSLLFAMGLQNSLVTRISNAAVRTTHLTGLFTDLGIEVAQFFFYRKQDQRNLLISSIKLRLTIISFFFLGGIVSGILYSLIALRVLAFAAFLLIGGLIYDSLKFKIIQMRRK
jgi:uncharacterized membrane protein YoaK (UPF0700 family)